MGRSSHAHRVANRTVVVREVSYPPQGQLGRRKDLEGLNRVGLQCYLMFLAQCLIPNEGRKMGKAVMPVGRGERRKLIRKEGWH